MLRKELLLKLTQIILLLIFVTDNSAQTVIPADTTNNISGGEKIYIHYDKPYYAAGETIWFKCYLYDNGLPSVKSLNVYLQLLDSKGMAIQSKKYPVSGATVKGNINLPAALAEGYYTIRAVTAYTTNIDGFIYSKNIYIYNLSIKLKDTVARKKILIQFFPESGNLTDSIFTQVGFKATDEYGNPLDVSGVVKSGNNLIVGSFRSLHNGIGKFSFKPIIGQKYYAQTDLNGQTFTYQLPDVQPTGINLKVADEPNGKVYELARNAKTPISNITLVVRLNKEIVFENQISFENELVLRGHLTTNNLPSGILQFTVLNAQGLPLAQRLSFVNNGEYKRTPTFKVILSDSAKRGANKFTIQLPANIETSCSISITEASAQTYPDKENIYSRLLLTGDLKGYIYNPGWYFKDNDSKTMEALDNVMMIHGWSRYNIEKTSASIPKLKDEYLITVTGVVNDAKTRRPVSGGVLEFGIVSEDSTTQKVKIPVDPKGRFVLDSLLIFGQAKLYYTYSTYDGSKPNIIIVADKILNDTGFNTLNFQEQLIIFLPLKNNIYQQPFFTPAPFENIKQLPEIVISKKGERIVDKVNEKYTSGMFRSSGKVVVDNINHPYIESSLSVVEYIKTNINSIQLAGGGFVNRKNFSLGSGGMWRVEVLLNESPASVATIASIRMKDVALIKFYEAGFSAVGSGAPGGAVAIYLKKDEDGTPSALAGNISNIKYISVEGYSVTQEFYNPDYSIADPRHALPDKRITLYWNPDANTSAASPEININFYNNDFTKKFKVIIEGLDNSGKLIHFEKVIGN